MPDLDQQLRSLIDGARAPIELDAVLDAGVPTLSSGSPHRRGRIALLAAAAVLLVAASAALLVRDGDEPVTTAPTTSSTATTLPAPAPPTEPQVVVAPTRVGDLAVSTSPLVPAQEPECPDSASCISSHPWLQHVVTIRNEGEQTIHIDDTRSSALVAGSQLLVGDCGYGTVGDGRSLIPGVCTLVYEGATLEPGESMSLTISLWRDLPSMEPLTSATAWWRRELRYASRPFTEDSEPSTFASLDMLYVGLVPGATPTPAGPVAPVAVSLHHCGIEPLTFEGGSWEVPDEEEAFDATNAPAWFAGRGTVGRSVDGDDLVYTDESGLTLRFVPDDGIERACA